MQSGFNTNIRHRGVLFHVQTEDSGKANPHVITHLFHGGNIMASEKRDYSEQLAAGGNLEQVVRALMESQHKAMLKRLRAGEHDAVILERLGPEAFDAPSGEVQDPTDTAAAMTPESPTLPPEDETPAPPPPAAGGARPAAAAARAFGQGVVSAKPLDEVVLDYLVESARKRKRAGR
ncbi:MAG: hypothetical protein R3E88_07715 [Myxococcota bacterium]